MGARSKYSPALPMAPCQTKGHDAAARTQVHHLVFGAELDQAGQQRCVDAETVTVAVLADREAAEGVQGVGGDIH